MNKLKLNFAFFALFIFLPFGHISALTNPSIVSFDVLQPSISHGQISNITWTLSNTTGYTVKVSCPLGVKVTDSSYNNYPCNTQTQVSTSLPNDALSLIFFNNSGDVQSSTITLTPKDEVGTMRDELSQSRSVSVSPNLNIVGSFTVATSTIPANSTTTIKWVATDKIPGVNFILSCNDNLTVYLFSKSNSPLPCGNNISTTDFPSSSSLDLFIVSRSIFETTVSISLVPAIETGYYNGVRSKTSTLTIGGLPQMNPTVTSAIASPQNILSDGTTTLSWVTADTSGANVRISCNSNISIGLLSGQSTTTTPVYCGNFISSQPITEKTISLKFTNSSAIAQTVTAEILPANTDGTYNGTKEKTINLNISGIGAPVVNPVTTQTQAVQTNSPASNTTTKKFTFTKSLTRGTNNSEVKELQKYFVRFPEIYGKVTVNGSYGPATEKLVMKFQEKYSVTKKGGAGYGSVGPATRKKLNEVQ